jgi:glycosyltransferase involved in cell wall biosynthesis
MADGLVADGWAAAELPAKLGHPVHSVPKGVDAERFRPAGPNLRGELGVEAKRVILSVGRFVPIKNTALTIEAMARVAQRDSTAHLVLVGEGPELANLKAQVERLGIGNRVTFAGYVPQDELGPYYRSADVFVLASDFDNSPNVVLEAMSCGVPVVATNVGGVADYVAAPRGGDLVPSRDAAALARALGDWLHDANRRSLAGAFNRQRVVEQFSWRASAQRLLEVYQTVIDERRSRLRVPA